MNALAEWDGRTMGGDGLDGPITKYLEALQQVADQNLDEENGRVKMHQGVAPDRRVSIEDEDMRHGRKSKSKRFNGYKEHVAADGDTGVILACAVTPANVPEEEAAPMLKADIEAQGLTIHELSIDLGYANSSIVDDIENAGGDVLCKPWPSQNNRGLFTKKDFTIDLRAKTITCPNGEVEELDVGEVVEFDPEACGGCRLRAQCTHSASGRGRTVRLADDERRQQRLRKLARWATSRFWIAAVRRRLNVFFRVPRYLARGPSRAETCAKRCSICVLSRRRSRPPAVDCSAHGLSTTRAGVPPLGAR